MKELIDFLAGFNLQTLIGMGALLWLFTRDIKKEIASIHKEFKFINIRLSRTEGTVYGKDIYKQDKEGI